MLDTVLALTDPGLVEKILSLVIILALALFIYIGYATKSERQYRDPERQIGFFSLLWQFTINGALLGYAGIFTILGSVMLFLPDAMVESSKGAYTKEGLMIMGGVTYGIGLVSFLSMFRFFRNWFKPIFPGFNPERLIHKVGLVLFISIILFQLFYMYQFQQDPYALIGALKGKDLLVEAGYQAFLFLLFALISLGVGLARSFPKAFERLGLWPINLTLQQWGILVALALVMVIVNKFIEPLMTPYISPFIIQAMEAFTESLFKDASHFQIVISAILLGVFAGFGEELMFRGLLQPVFGIIPVNIIFTLMHVQYGLTPILILLFIVGCVFGWVRKKYGTVASMTVHALYNAATIILSVVLSSIH